MLRSAALRIAIVTESTYVQPNQPWADDGWLKEALEARGHRVDIIDWRSSAAVGNAMHRFDAVYVSTCWDIPTHAAGPQQFLSFLDECEGDGRLRLVNSRRVLKFGLWKDQYIGYLSKAEETKDLVIPTRFYHLPRGEGGVDGDGGESTTEVKRWWTAIKQRAMTERIVIKPIIGADGIHTKILDFSNHGNQQQPPFSLAVKNEHEIFGIEEGKQVFDSIVSRPELRGIMVQPYAKSVETNGEFSFTVIDWDEHWCIQKPRGFRASRSSDRVFVPHNGVPFPLLDAVARVCRALQSKFGGDEIVRMRMDFFYDGHETVRLSELELVEPNTNLLTVERGCKKEQNRATECLADALITRIDWRMKAVNVK